jgi:hypothetical protein
MAPRPVSAILLAMSNRHPLSAPAKLALIPALAMAVPLAVALTSAAPVLAGELHDVTAAPGKTTVGTPGKTSVTLAAKNGWHLNPDAPISVKLTPPAGVTVDKAKLGRKDLALSTPEKARFDVGFAADAPGSKSIECETSFVICQESACKPIKETVTLNVDVAAADTAAKKKH